MSRRLPVISDELDAEDFSPTNDPRASSIDELIPTGEQEDIVRQELGSFLDNDPVAARDVAEMILEIQSYWRKAHGNFLAIGQRLLALERRVGYDGFERARTSVKLFPFGKAVASQLRKVALAVEYGRLNPNEMPPNYAVAYQFAAMEDAEFALAKADQVYRIDVTRREVTEWRQKRRHSVIVTSSKIDLVAAERERGRLERRMRAIAAERETLAIRLSELNRILFGENENSS